MLLLVPGLDVYFWQHLQGYGLSYPGVDGYNWAALLVHNCASSKPHELDCRGTPGCSHTFHLSLELVFIFIQLAKLLRQRLKCEEGLSSRGTQPANESLLSIKVPSENKIPKR